MTLGFVASIVRSAIFQILLISGPVLIISVLVGLVISVFQATTSIQEQTLTFVPKIIAIFLTVAILGPVMFTLLGEYTVALFEQIPDMLF
ncbi:MAG: flagellar biosynthesis protein FliQ [Spirochaetales bacterium]|nr:flagellar biosynthesis protein FliQ [Spirochaetales bacterium]